jgi:hypothetical protein
VTENAAVGVEAALQSFMRSLRIFFLKLFFAAPDRLRSAAEAAGHDHLQRAPRALRRRSFLPRTPPAALMSSMAISADLVGDVSKAAIQPLNEVAASISISLSSAIAGQATQRARIAGVLFPPPA